MGRYLRHVLPKGFRRIRHYGLLGNGRRVKLARCREVLGVGSDKRRGDTQADDIERGEGGEDAERCPECGEGRMVRLEELPRNCGPPRAQRRAA